MTYAGDIRALWFRSVYADAIIAGSKTATVRRDDAHVPAVDEVIALSVGPRPPFARARVVAVQRLRWDQCAQLAPVTGHRNGAAMRRALVELYGEGAALVVIRFELIDP